MAGFDSSVIGGNHGDEEPPVARAKLRQLGNSLLEAMERMFNERLLTAGGRGPQEEEFGDENSGFGNRFHDHFGNGRGGRRADFYNQHGGGRRRDRCVHFDDQNEARDEYDDGFNDIKNPFARQGQFGQPHKHCRGAGHDGEIIMVVAIEMIERQCSHQVECPKIFRKGRC